MSLSSIRALLIDLSGTIHVENEVILGAVEAVKKLRDAKVPLKFVTNTTKVRDLLLVFGMLVAQNTNISSNVVNDHIGYSDTVSHSTVGSLLIPVTLF